MTNRRCRICGSDHNMAKEPEVNVPQVKKRRTYHVSSIFRLRGPLPRLVKAAVRFIAPLVALGIREGLRILYEAIQRRGH